MSKESARPARSATENQRHKMDLTTSSTEGGMCNEDLKLGGLKLC